MRKVLGLSALLLFLALPALAQENPKGELFLGYSYARLQTASPERANLNGWNGAIQGNVRPWLGLVGDFSGHYGMRTVAPGIDKNINEHTALFGPRIMMPSRIRPFAHVLFGVAKGNAGLFGSSASETAFGMAAGGGLDTELNYHVAIRLIQGDYLMNRFLKVNHNNFRLSSGIVFRW